MRRLLATGGGARKGTAVFIFLKTLAANGQLRPNHPLSPAKLGERFGVSETPVREALARLSAEGFVELRDSNQGYYSKFFNAPEQRGLLEVVFDLLEASMAVAANGAAADVVEGLAGTDISIAQADNAPLRVAELAERMYLHLAQATGNVPRVEMTQLLLERTRLIRVIDLRVRDTAVATVEAVAGVGKSLLAADLNSARALARGALSGRLSRLDHLVGQANAEASITPFLIGDERVTL